MLDNAGRHPHICTHHSDNKEFNVCMAAQSRISPGLSTWGFAEALLDDPYYRLDTSSVDIMSTVRTMRFGSTAKVLLKCKLKYYRISECVRLLDDARRHPHICSPSPPPDNEDFNVSLVTGC